MMYGERSTYGGAGPFIFQIMLHFVPSGLQPELVSLPMFFLCFSGPARPADPACRPGHVFLSYLPSYGFGFRPRPIFVVSCGPTILKHMDACVWAFLVYVCMIVIEQTNIGAGDSIWTSYGEPLIVAFKKLIKRQLPDDMNIVMEESPAGHHQLYGVAERCVQDMQNMTRILN